MTLVHPTVMEHLEHWSIPPFENTWDIGLSYCWGRLGTLVHPTVEYVSVGLSRKKGRKAYSEGGSLYRLKTEKRAANITFVCLLATLT